MLSQTTKLNFEIISFVMQDKSVKKLLENRDESNNAKAIQLNCRFYKMHPKDSNKFGYFVDFLFTTKYKEMEENDDVTVLVEVVNSKPMTFKVVNIQKY